MSWLRVTKSEPCVVCEKTDWCAYTEDGELALCMRAESNKPHHKGGWIHRLKERSPHPAIRRQTKPQPKTPSVDVMRLALEFRAGAPLDTLSKQLGLSVASLDRLWAGWDGRAWAFPMRDGQDRVIGIRRRFPDGKKFTLKGTCNGLFIPDDVLAADDDLFICEGPTDTGALLDLGFNAIGRPSCSSGADMLKVVLRRKRRDVVIVSDNDEPKRRPDGSIYYPGQDGAKKLAEDLKGFAHSIRVIKPLKHKDIRQWLIAGCTANAIRALAVNAWRVF